VEVLDGSGPYTRFQPPYTGPFGLDEPKRIDEGGTADEWRSFGAGAAFFCAHATVHGGPWAQRCDASLLDDATIERIDAFIDGMASVAVQRYHGYNHPDDQGSLRRYTRTGEDGQRYEVSVKPFGFRSI